MTAPIGYNIETNSLYKDMLHLEKQIQVFASTGWKKRNIQLSNLLIIGGPVGVGKTEFTQRFFQKYNMDFEPVSLDGNNAGKVLHANNEEGLVLLFDDQDNILFNQAPLKMIRAATTSGDRFLPNNRSMQGCLEDTDDPTGFTFLGKICIISNFDKNNKKLFTARVNVLLEGLKSRAGLNQVDFGENATALERYHFACWVLTEQARKEWKQFKVAEINKLLRWWAINHTYLPEVTSRILFYLLKDTVSLPEKEYYEYLESKVATTRPKNFVVDEDKFKKLLWTYESDKDYFARTKIKTSNLPEKPKRWTFKKREQIANIKPGKGV